MPQLSRRALALFLVEQVFEVGVSLAQLGLELELVTHGIEVEGLAGAEDDGLFGEVAVRGVVQTICGFAHCQSAFSKSAHVRAHEATQHIPSIKSRSSIFTFRGRSVLFFSSCSEMYGYCANSSLRSSGRMCVRCCQRLSLVFMPRSIDGRVPMPRLGCLCLLARPLRRP